MLRKLSNTRFALIFLLFAVGCTTEKNTWITRHFHNTCAHFNGYFWGKLSFQDGLQKLDATHKEDFSDVIPVYVYADQTEVTSIFPEMDRTILKTKTMIENHTITDKNKHEIYDAVKYIKYCYLLNAQANLYKNEYLKAIDEFDYTSRVYKGTDVKFEAMIWQARAFNQMGSVSRAEELIDYLKSNKSLPEKLMTQVYAVTADYYERTGQWEEVAKWITKAIGTEKKKSVRARYYFILAQLAAKGGEPKKAFDYYTKVLKSHPPYDLEFEAKINRALLFMGGPKENESIKKELNKMLKPTKNSDNRDQIYYALAQIALKEGDTALCIKDMNKSIRTSTTNQRQKALSYMALANFNFDWEEYVLSKRYFDSTLTALPKNSKGRDSIVAKRDNLQKLVTYLEVITFQDSVQKLAKMDKKDLDKYIDDIIANARQADEDKKKQLEAASAPSTSNPNGNATVSNGKWYFYNPALETQGTEEFIKKWGNRNLEDNWRRSKKMIDASAATSGAETTAKDSSAAKGKNVKTAKDSSASKYNRAHYLKNIPLTDAKFKKSVDSVIDAYYNAGAIYKEYLHNYRRSSAEFEELLQRFPDNKYKLIVYYELYVIYKLVHNDDRMNYYKNLLLTKYPNTVYAKLVSDPDKYARDVEANKQAVLKLYGTTIDDYKHEKWAQMMIDCQQADSLYPKNDLTPRFAYLEAIATGGTQGEQAYKDALTKITIDYPRDSVKILAQNVLNYLNKKPVAPPPVKDTTVTYLNSPDTVYLWVLLVDNKESQKISDVRNKLTDLNSKTFSQSNLSTDEIFLNANQLMIVMKKFATQDLAKNYYTYLKNSDDVFKTLPPSAYQTFYISQQNYRLLFGHKKADEYLQFFKDKMP